MVRRVGWSGCGSSPTVLPSRMGVIIGWQNGVTFESKLTYRGPKLKEAIGSRWTVQTIMRPKDAEGLVPLRVRWVVERTFSWLGRSRRLAKDWERKVENSISWVLVASIRFKLSSRTVRLNIREYHKCLNQYVI